MFIDAPDSEAALQWGQQISERFVAWLFEREGSGESTWTRTNFANWIEPPGTEEWDAFRDMPTVSVGELPAFDMLER